MGASSQYERAWEKYRQFALTSRSLKAKWERWQVLFLWMTILGTISAALGTQSVLPFPAKLAPAFGFIGAAVLAVGAFLSKEFYSPSRELVWTKARAIGEAIKSDVFRFATGTPLEDGKSTEADLLNRTGEHAAAFGEGHELLASDNSPPPMVPMTLKDYAMARLEDQKKFYQKALQKAKQGHARFRAVQLLLGALTVILGIVAGVGSSSERANALIVLVSALSGILASHAALTRHDYLRKSYASLSQRMSDLIAKAGSAANPSLFVAQCEAEMSAEHRSWLAEWQKKPDAAPSGQSQAP